jgi:sortase A
MFKQRIKTVATSVAIAFFFSSIFVLIYFFTTEGKVHSYVSLINMTAVEVKTNETPETSFDVKTNKLVHYPDLGVRFATIKIPSLDLSLPVYHGDTNKILRKGIGHYSGSFFPGENGTIILAGHNYENMFRNIDLIPKKEIITLKTTYGTFKYEVYDKKIVKATNTKAFKIQHKDEILILYSCWPLHQRTFFKSERYVVYAKKVSDNLE